MCPTTKMTRLLKAKKNKIHHIGSKQNASGRKPEAFLYENSMVFWLWVVKIITKTRLFFLCVSL